MSVASKQGRPKSRFLVAINSSFQPYLYSCHVPSPAVVPIYATRLTRGRCTYKWVDDGGVEAETTISGPIYSESKRHRIVPLFQRRLPRDDYQLTDYSLSHKAQEEERYKTFFALCVRTYEWPCCGSLGQAWAAADRTRANGTARTPPPPE